MIYIYALKYYYFLILVFGRFSFGFGFSFGFSFGLYSCKSLCLCEPSICPPRFSNAHMRLGILVLVPHS